MSIWFRLNNSLRNQFPLIHATLKKWTTSWRNSGTPFLSVPMQLANKWFLLHPQFLTHGEVEPDVQSYMSSVLREGDVVLDIGANFGFHTLLCSRLVGKTGSIFAFEPSPENMKILRYHCRINRLSNVKLFDIAIGNENQSAVDFVLVDGGKHSSNSLTIKDSVPFISASQKKTIQVEIKTIDDICLEHNLKPNLIKIDVEGAELLVLYGASQIIETVKPHIVMGVHPFWLPKGQVADDIVCFLRSRGYSIKNCRGHEVDSLEYGDYIAECKV